MLRILPAVLLIVLAIYSWIELAQSDPHEVRQLPRAMWAVFILIPLFGPLAWLAYGRPNGEDPTPRPPRPPRVPQQMAPDDDPEFLRSIKIDPPPDA